MCREEYQLHLQHSASPSLSASLCLSLPLSLSLSTSVSVGLSLLSAHASFSDHFPHRTHPTCRRAHRFFWGGVRATRGTDAGPQERFFEAHRLLARHAVHHGPGFWIRFTVQYNLFAGTILAVGGDDQIAALDEMQTAGTLGIQPPPARTHARMHARTTAPPHHRTTAHHHHPLSSCHLRHSHTHSHTHTQHTYIPPIPRRRTHTHTHIVAPSPLPRTHARTHAHAHIPNSRRSHRAKPHTCQIGLSIINHS